MFVKIPRPRNCMGDSTNNKSCAKEGFTLTMIVSNCIQKYNVLCTVVCCFLLLAALAFFGIARQTLLLSARHSMLSARSIGRHFHWLCVIRERRGRLVARCPSCFHKISTMLSSSLARSVSKAPRVLPTSLHRFFSADTTATFDLTGSFEVCFGENGAFWSVSRVVFHVETNARKI
jgi:hypothetical protein